MFHYLFFPSGLNLHKVSETASTITLGWRPRSGIGYRFFKDGKIVSHTWNSAVESTRFSKDATTYGVQVLRPGESDVYP